MMRLPHFRFHILHSLRLRPNRHRKKGKKHPATVRAKRAGTGMAGGHLQKHWEVFEKDGKELANDRLS